MAQAPRIYITGLHLSHGGVERVIVSLANAFAHRGFAVEILCTYNLGEPAYPLDGRVSVRYLTEDRPNRAEIRVALQEKALFSLAKELIYAAGVLRRKKRTMKKALSEIGEGVVISTRHEHSLLLSRYGQKGVFKIAQLHADHAFDKKLISEMRSGYTNIDALPLFFENSVEEVGAFFEGVEKHPRLLVIPNFIDEVTPPVTEKKKQVIAAGRLHADKDFFSLLRIWKKVLASHPDHTLVIAGEGEEEAALRAYAEELGIAKSVELCGALPYETLLSEMAASRAYALTSISESFSLVLVEAAASGCVPVAYDVRVGPRGILTEGEDGFLIPHGDEDAFAEKLSFLLSHDDVRLRMQEKAKINAKRYFKDSVMELWVDLITNRK
ncbi:MAG: glycosyltransferase [Clostridia bacterium]|nr:glycosyltransferase [Clostridia bacterium]